MVARGKTLGSANRIPAATMPSTRITFHRGKCSIAAQLRFTITGASAQQNSIFHGRGCLGFWARRRLSLDPDLGDGTAEDLDPDPLRDLDLELLVVDLGDLA